MIRLLASIGALMLMSACGGGADNTHSARPALGPSTVSPSTGTLLPILNTANIQFFGSQQVATKSTVGFAILAKNNMQIESVRWQQTEGELLTILATNSQTIGFDVPSSGSYTLQAHVKLKNQNHTSTYTINFSAADNQRSANVRLDHTVTELGKVSLHLGDKANKLVASVQWTQTAGPQAQNPDIKDDFLFFDAPSVTQDEVINYRADITYDDGTSAFDDVLITVKNVDFTDDGLFLNSETVISEDIFAANQNSPFKQALQRCIYNNNIPARPDCSFSELPLLGMSTNGETPSVSDILDRTLVSHPWMAERFENYLTNSSVGLDMRNLLRAVSAVVISYDVRPSFYWVATGAIYLDANSFWQTPQERDTLNDVPDYRSNFGSDLQFKVFWRYTKNNDYYPATSYPKQNRTQRTFADVEASISWLMYHELAHANDFFPPSAWPYISTNLTPLDYFQSRGSSSDILDATYPLRSDEMHALAQVRYRNETATNLQKSYVGADIADFFEPDIAPSFYAYLTTREDFATLFERYMMLYRLDSHADIAIIDATDNDDFIVAWGQRNRITDIALRDRVSFVVQRVYPEITDVRESFTLLPEPIMMDTNLGWFDNLAISTDTSTDQNERTRSKAKTNLSTSEKHMRASLDGLDIHAGKPETSK